MRSIYIFLVCFLCSSDSLWSQSEKDHVSDAAQDAIENGDLTTAKDLFEAYLKDHPKDEEVLVWLSGVYGLMHDPYTQKKLCLEALDNKQKSPGAYLNLGNAQCALGDWDEAERSFLSAYHTARERKLSLDMMASAYALSNFYLARPNQDNALALTWANTCLTHINPKVKNGTAWAQRLLEDGKQTPHAMGNTYKLVTINRAGAMANQGDFDGARNVLIAYLNAYPCTQDVEDMLESFPR